MAEYEQVDATILPEGDYTALNEVWIVSDNGKGFHDEGDIYEASRYATVNHLV